MADILPKISENLVVKRDSGTSVGNETDLLKLSRWLPSSFGSEDANLLFEGCLITL